MNARHAVAVALLEWYLMVPPAHDESGRIDALDGAPLSEWWKQSSFKSAKECEVALVKFRSSARSNKEHREPKAHLSKELRALDRFALRAMTRASPDDET